jgi:hypothetical protein
MNVVDPVIEEIHEARRKLWDESDGTMAGYSRHCEEVAWEFRARVAAEVARKKAAGTWVPYSDAVPEGVGAMMVGEGDASTYGAETQDSARKGGKGEG